VRRFNRRGFGVPMPAFRKNISSTNLNTSQMNRSQVAAYPIMTPKGGPAVVWFIAFAHDHRDPYSTCSSTGHQLEEAEKLISSLKIAHHSFPISPFDSKT
jgi:hypothetical protein